jgi:outer membrane biosynthesis protein TonB
MEATFMKLIGIMSTAVLSLTLGVAAPAYAQQEQHDQQEEQKDKPAQDEKKAQPEKSVNPEEKSAHPQETNTKPEEKNAQPERNSKPEERNAQQNNNAKPEEKNAQEQRTQQARPEQQGQRAGNNGGSRIPDDRFKANFGQQHRFRVSQGDYSNRRFEYGGYSFGFVDAWPSNWLYTQDVYVIEINGMYYLCNPSYPGVNIALSFTL